MTREQYFALPAMSSSVIKQGLKSMLNMKHYTDHGIAATASMKLGSLVNAALLLPVEFHARYPIWSKRKAGAEWQAFEAKHADALQIMSVSEYDAACGMRDAVLRCTPAKEMLRGCTAELVIQWDDELAGPSKCMIDYVDHLRWGDLKSAKSAEPWTFSSQAYSLGYDVQMAWYRRGVRSTGKADNGMVSMIVVTNSPPYDCAVYRVPDQYMDHGEKRLEDVLKQWKVAKHLDRYPGVCTEVTDLELPGWVTGGEQVKLIDDDGSEVTL